MVQLIADRRDIDFVLYEQLGIEDLLQTEKFSGLNRKMFDMIISEARNFGIKELLPTYSQGDREGVQLDSGRVTVPACFHRAYDLFVEGEWLAMAEDPQSGGQGLPRIIKQAAFYDGLLKTAEYFIRTMLPITMGKMDSIMAADSSAVAMHTKSFGT